MGKKLLLDFALAVVLLLLMAYSLIGELEHEILGVAIAALIIFHQIKNFSWYCAIPKGKYNLRRIILTATNFLLLILMAVQIISGVILSKDLFVNLNLGFSFSTARLVHLSASYWLFILISVHIGLHWKIILAFAQKKFQIGKFAQVLGKIFALYGIYALINRRFVDYMFLESEFVFLDFSEPIIFFLVDYVAIMALFILISNWLTEKL